MDVATNARACEETIAPCFEKALSQSYYFSI